MKNINIFRFFFLPLSMMLLLVQSCSDDNLMKEETALEKKNQLVEVTPVVEKLLEKGFNIEDIEELEQNYLVENDMLFSKNIKDYPFMPGIQNRHYYGPETVSPENIQNMTVYCQICFEDGGVFGEENDWHTAVQQAIDAWNAVGQGCCIRFTRVFAPLGAHITISDGSPLNMPLTLFGSGDSPIGGLPGKRIYINLAETVIAQIPSIHQKRNLIAHELGHTIGFRHTDANIGFLVPGTGGSTDPLSIMQGELVFINNQNVLSEMDKIAARSLYGGCTTPPPPCPTGSIVGSSSIHCTNSTTYTLSGATAINWSVSSNLQIVSSTGTSITVIKTNAVQPAETFIQANLANGCPPIKRVVSIAGAPTPPNGNNPVIWGPSLLKSYQTGVFSTPIFTNYLTVQWTVWSSTMGNVSQNFQISPTNPTVPNGFSVYIGVLATTPAGQYTLRCKVSNSCGDYFIERTFNVELGPPELFDVY